MPIVAFDTPVHREYLGDLGLYAPVGDAAGLASVLENALADPAGSARLGEALRKRAIECFTWQHAASQIEAIYAGLLARHFETQCDWFRDEIWLKQHAFRHC